MSSDTVRSCMQRRTRKLSIAASIFRLLVFLACMNHLVACAWWYLGVVFIPADFDGSRSEDWIQHAAMPTLNLIENVSADPSHTASARLCNPAWTSESLRTLHNSTLEPFVAPMDVTTSLQEEAEVPAAAFTVGKIDSDGKIPSAEINGAWVPLTGPVPSMDEPAAFNSWVFYYQGLGVDILWPDRCSTFQSRHCECCLDLCSFRQAAGIFSRCSIYWPYPAGTSAT